MSTTVTYKGATLTTVSNDTAVLETAGKYLEDDLTLVDVSGGGGLDFDVKTVNVANNTPTVTRAFNNFIFIAQVAEDELPSTYTNNNSYFMMFAYVDGAFINKTGDKGYGIRTNSSSYPFNGNSTNMNSTSVGSTSITFSTYTSNNMFHANWEVLQIELPSSADYPLYSFSTH